jgi:hypothetical protein
MNDDISDDISNAFKGRLIKQYFSRLFLDDSFNFQQSRVVCMLQEN